MIIDSGGYRFDPPAEEDAPVALIGRDDLLRALRTRLREPSGAVRLAGPSAVGKSTLACAVARRGVERHARARVAPPGSLRADPDRPSKTLLGADLLEARVQRWPLRQQTRHEAVQVPSFVDWWHQLVLASQRKPTRFLCLRQCRHRH